MRYLVLDVVVLAVVALGVLVAARRLARAAPPDRVRWAAVGLAAVPLLVLTAVFDNVMIAVGLFSYAPEHLAGPAVGRAPVEDFAYPLAAVVGLPVLWHVLAAHRARPAPAVADRGAEDGAR